MSIRVLSPLPIALVLLASCSAAELESAKVQPAKLDPQALEVAKKGFELYRDLQFDEYAKLIDEEELLAFRDEFVVLTWQMAEAEGQLDAQKELLGVASLDELRAADPGTMLARFMASRFAKGSEEAEGLALAKFELLGHVVEGDDQAYVLTLDSPGEAGLYPLRRAKSGEWKLRLKSDPRPQAVMMRKVFEWKQEGKTAQEMRGLMGRPRVVRARLLGLVKEDADTVHAVVRAVTRIESLDLEEDVVSVHAIGSDTNVWPALDPNDPASIADEERRSKIEEALSNSWNGVVTADDVD